MDLTALGKLVIGLGLSLAVLGVVLFAVGRGLSWHLPGDLSLRFGGVRVFFPIASSLLLSILVTLVLNLIARR